jgi:hypothetical protein
MLGNHLNFFSEKYGFNMVLLINIHHKIKTAHLSRLNLGNIISATCLAQIGFVIHAPKQAMKHKGYTAVL